MACTSHQGRHQKYNEQIKGLDCVHMNFYKLCKVRHFLMRLKLNKHLFVVVYIQGIQKNCIVRGESVRDSARRILAHGRRSYILPTSGVLFWLTGFDIIRELPYPNLTSPSYMLSLSKVVVLYLKRFSSFTWKIYADSKWFIFGSDWLWMYRATVRTDCISQFSEQ